MGGISTIVWRGNIPGIMDIKEILTFEEEGCKIAKSSIRGFDGCTDIDVLLIPFDFIS